MKAPNSPAESQADSSASRQESVVLGSDLGFVLGAVFRSYVKTANLVLDELPGGARGYQVVSAAVCGDVDSQGGLAQRLGVDRTVMTYLLDDLEQAGLVARRPDPADRRSRKVVGTDKGASLCEAIQQRLRLVEDRVLEPLSPDERATLHQLLGRIATRAVAVDPTDDACKVLSDLAAEPVVVPPRARRARRK